MNRKGEALSIEHDVADAGSDREQAARARAADAGQASGDDAGQASGDDAGQASGHDVAQPQRADDAERSDTGYRDGDPDSYVSVEDRVRRRVAELDGIEHQPLATHAERYDEIHAELQAALTEIDGESGG